jgi:hypothetical protein
MIDNPELTADLITKLEGALPLPAIVTPQLAGSIREQSPEAPVPRTCQVVEAFNVGDEGGIMGVLSIEGRDDGKTVFLASITHLDFDRRLPLAREIAAYRKRRVKKLRRQMG